MKANELRIGNKVEYKGEIVDIISINGVVYSFGKIDIGIKTNDGFRGVDLKKLFPIHLTEDWLLKFGFTKRSTSNNCNKWFKGENPVTHDWLFSLVWLVGHPTPFYQNGYHMIKYVHQLQNLYYALTGEELCLQ